MTFRPLCVGIRTDSADSTPSKLATWIHPLRENGVHLVTVAQGKIDWKDFAGRMLYGIQQEGKHAYPRDHYLIRGGHLTRGKSFCQRYSVREDVVLDHVIGAIEREYLNPKTIHRLRKELERQLTSASKPVDPKPLRKQLAKLEKQLDTARRNMVLAEADFSLTDGGCIDRGIQAVTVSRRGENHLSGKRHFAILRRWRTPPQASFWLAVSARFHRIAQSN